MIPNAKAAAAAAAMCIAALCCAREIKTSFTPCEGVVENPGQGLMHVINRKRMEGAPYGAYYSRFAWADLEPEEGKYDWSEIDRMIGLAKKTGIPFSFRIMCANYHSKKPYVTPKWALDKGIKHKPYNWEKERQNPRSPFTTMTRYTPYFDDPLLIELHARFVRELAKRYDGNPHISSIDIGGYGNWGEWHTYRLGIPEAAEETRRKFADMYLDNFKKTELVFMSDDAKTLEYALGKGGEFPKVGIRRDGVGGPWHYKNWIGSKKYANVPNMGEIWKSKPVVLEFIENAGKQKEWSMRRAVDFILSNHACLFNENWQVAPLCESDKEIFRELFRGLGARICLKNATVSAGDRCVSISIEGENAGNCKIYLPYELVYELRAPDGKAAASFPSSADPSKWLPGKFSASDRFEIPQTLPPGKYGLFARLAHRGGALRDFKFAVSEAEPGGSVRLAELDL